MSGDRADRVEPDYPLHASEPRLDVAIPPDFVLTSGQRLSGTVRARLVGPAQGPLVVVAGGISADRQAADTPDTPGWWGWAIGDGAALDTSRLRLLAFDWSSGNGGDQIVTITHHRPGPPAGPAAGRSSAPSASTPSSAPPTAAASAWLSPSFSPSGSSGWPSSPPPTAPIPRPPPCAGCSAACWPSPATAGREAEGIALARQLAMTTYRTADEFALRFSQTAPPGPATPSRSATI
jgi:homoserine O-acetyltransferase